jgi:hypothetical protein
MNVRHGKEQIEDGKMTRDEFRNLMKAMDKEGFDTLMQEYVKEVSNPENVKETNEYLKQAEKSNDLPKNVKLVTPNKGICIKSEKFSIKRPSVRQKVYLNLCTYDCISPPKEESKNMWSLPHLLNKGRSDQDKKGNLCTVYDVVFHPDAIKYANQNISFKNYVCESAINGVNKNILKSQNEKISSDYLIKSYLYKGTEVAMINVHSLHSKELDSRIEPTENYKTQVQKEIEGMKDKNEEEDDEKEFDKPDINIEPFVSEEKIEYPIAPNFKIKYSDDFEIHKFFYDPHMSSEAQYKKLVIDLQVPLLDNLNKSELQLDTKKLNFKYKDIYHIEIDLPVDVDKEKSDAKFDRKKNLLSISALIVRRNKEELKFKVDNNIEIISEECVKENSNIEVDKNPQSETRVQLTNKRNVENDNYSKEENYLNPENKELLDMENKISTSSEDNNKITANEDKKESEKLLLSPELKNETLNLDSQIIGKNLITEIKDEDDVQQKEVTKQNEEVIKISYINFECDIIYEID